MTHESSEPGMGSYEKQYPTRLEQAVAFFETTLAEYDEEQLGSVYGVYAELHGYGNSDTVLALAPNLPLVINPFEMGHSVFDNMLGRQILRDQPPVGTPEQIETVQQLGFSRDSVVAKGYLYKRQGKRVLGLFEQGGKIPSKVVAKRLRDSFGIDVIALDRKASDVDAVPEAIDFDSYPTILSDVIFKPIESEPMAALETGITDYVSVTTDQLSGTLVAAGHARTIVTAGLAFRHAMQPTHQRVLDLLIAEYGEDAVPDYVTSGSWDLFDAEGDILEMSSRVRYMFDQRRQQLKFDVLVTPVAMTKETVRQRQDDIECYCGVLLVAALQGFTEQRPETADSEVMASLIVTSDEAVHPGERPLNLDKTFLVDVDTAHPDAESVFPQVTRVPWRVF